MVNDPITRSNGCAAELPFMQCSGMQNNGRFVPISRGAEDAADQEWGELELPGCTSINWSTAELCRPNLYDVSSEFQIGMNSVRFGD